MHFEDYNYELYNKYVLIDPTKVEEVDESDVGDADSPPKPKEKMLGFSAPPTGEGMGGVEDQAAKKAPITENILE
jgi:hypothetical protein